jgi:hypothetical protein
MCRTMKTILVPVEIYRSTRAVYINPALVESLTQTNPRIVTIKMSSGAEHEVESDNLRQLADFLRGAEHAITIADDDA